jgi:hypothetical protein
MNQDMKTILEKVLTDDLPNLPKPPKFLYHYTSLETIQKILEQDNVRLSHAEYSNTPTTGTNSLRPSISSNPRSRAGCRRLLRGLVTFAGKSTLSSMRGLRISMPMYSACARV